MIVILQVIMIVFRMSKNQYNQPHKSPPQYFLIPKKKVGEYFSANGDRGNFVVFKRKRPKLSP